MRKRKQSIVLTIAITIILFISYSVVYITSSSAASEEQDNPSLAIQRTTSTSQSIDFSSALPMMQTISGKQALFHVKFLASEEMRGRETFSQEQLIAARYIANEYEKYGLKPVTDDGTYYQNIGSLYSKVGGPNELSIEDKTYTEGKDYETSAVGSGKVTALAAFAGYGITLDDYDDYSGLDVKDKIVVVMAGRPRDAKGRRWDLAAVHQVRVANAIAHGAVGMLLIKETAPKWNRKSPIGKEGTIQEQFQLLASMGPKLGLSSEITDKAAMIGESVSSFPMVYISLEVANDLLSGSKKTLSDLQENPYSFQLYKEVMLKTTVDIAQRKTMNVIGLLEGSDPLLKREAFIIGAHYDALGVDEKGKTFNSADDNASGVAALLEVAEAFARGSLKPKRSILFIAFTGEEKGAVGSGYYVEHPLFPLEKTSVMINLDTIARNEPHRIGIYGTTDSRTLEINEQASQIVEIGAKYVGNQLSSDEAVFAVKDIPVLLYFDGGSKDQHKQTDTWEKLDVTKLEKVARLAFLTAWGASQL